MKTNNANKHITDNDKDSNRGCTKKVGMNIAVQEWCAVLVSDKTPIVLHIINTINILNELQHVVVILW